ncbi:Uncharacterized mitochondrial protein AtMg00310, partial [Linum perenne]
VSWEKLCLPKEDGGLGFKDLETFNHALLAKQTWRLLHDPELLLAKIYKAKYYPNSSLMQAGKGSNPSWGWKDILKGRDIIKVGYRWQVGDGVHINPFLDHWIPSFPYFVPILKLEDSINQILSIPIPRRQVMDKIIWQFVASVKYSVQSGYEVAKEIMAELPQYEPVDVVDSKVWKGIWKTEIQPKFHFILWRILQRSLPVRAELNYRGLEIPTYSRFVEMRKKQLSTCSSTVFLRSRWLICVICQFVVIKVLPLCTHGGKLLKNI